MKIKNADSILVKPKSSLHKHAVRAILAKNVNQFIKPSIRVWPKETLFTRKIKECSLFSKFNESYPPRIIEFNVQKRQSKLSKKLAKDKKFMNQINKTFSLDLISQITLKKMSWNTKSIFNSKLETNVFHFVHNYSLVCSLQVTFGSEKV